MAGPAGGAEERTGSRIRHTTVFEQGENGYHTFRIPAVVQAADGTLLAFAEGRVDDPDDDGNIDLVLKRSTNGGASWSSLQVVVGDGANKFGNPVPVLDRTAGRIVLHTTRTGGGVTIEDVMCGRASEEETRRSFVLHSDDHGASWSAPKEITDQIRRPGWRHLVGGPGHGIQLRRGRHAGRLVIAGAHSVAPPEGSGIPCPDNRLFGAHSLYSDDGGASWHLGGIDIPLDGVVNPNESIAAELGDGTVYFNARDQRGNSPSNRAQTTSSDGGASFDAPYRGVADLVAPIVQGSVLKLSRFADRRERLVFSAPGNPDAREHLTLSTSADASATWWAGPVVHEGPAGYSDLVEIGGCPHDCQLGVLYECGVPTTGDPAPPYYQCIAFARVPIELLDGGGGAS
jgi:Neuraminidase (sialidase)